MASFIELIAKIKPKNNGTYPLVDDVDVEMEDGSRLSEAIKKPRIPDGGTKGQILAKKSDTNGDAEWVEPLKTEDIDKKLESKLDKNLGSENSDKVLTTDSQGNIITQNKEDFEGGGGTTDYNSLTNKPSINGVELKGNKTSGDLKMYTQEEVDDLLYDKMDKPYKPITITDDITIEDCLDGHFKINKILGNTYQAEESDIVPTPQRPIPINSRKTMITKINPNVFDLEKESDTSNIPDSGTYRSIGQYQLKSNTKYVFSWSEATVPAKATLSLQVQDDKGTVLVSPFTYFNLEATEKKETGKQVEFTTNESGIIKFAYNCTVGTSSTTETYQQYWYTKILKDITLKEDVEYATEYVELRSLKETGNLFDINFIKLLGNYSDSMTILDDGTVKVTNNDATLWPLKTKSITIPKSANYTIKYDFETISGGANSGWISLVNMSNDNSKIFSTSGKTLYLDAGDYYVRFYRGQGATDVENNIVQYSNIVLVEGTSAPSTYIPPTVRDYKIINHENKTAKIIRNIHNVSFNKNSVWSRIGDDKKGYRFMIVENQPLKILNYLEVNNGFSNMSNNAKNSVVNDNKSGSGWYCTSNSYTIKVDGLQMGTLDDFKQLLGDNEIIFQCQLATPVEEPITYIETDTSEVGYSWQDTTSPSPTIPAEIKGVDKIDITVTGKNLFDIDYVSNFENWTNSNSDGYFYIPIKVPKGKQLCLSNDKTIAGGRGYYANFSPYKDKNSENYYFFYHNTSSSAYGKFDKLTKDEVIYLRVNSITNNLPLFVEDFTHLQLEVGDIATAYEPYTEQRVNITLPQSMYENDVANVESGEYEYYTKNTTIDFNRFDGNLDLIQDNTVRYYFHKSFAQELDGIIPDTLLFDCFTNVDDDSDTVHFKIGGNNHEYIFMYIPRGHIDDKAYAKEYLSSLNLIANFAVETKTTQPIPEEDLAKLKSLKTEQGVTNIFIGGEVKPIIEARYALDIASIVSKLQTKLLTLQEEVIKNV